MSKGDEVPGAGRGQGRDGAEDGAQRQGGDLRGLPGDRDYLDLSTCANRYGPPEAVRTALRGVDPSALRAHPYEAEATFLSSYAEYLGTAEEFLVAGRGITEFIRVLARILPTESVAVITPDYTDTIASFPLHLGPANDHLDTADSRLSRIEWAMRRFAYVITSNPNNPLGVYIDRNELTKLCASYPQCTLILDEAYIEFTGGPRSMSMVNCDLDNVVVLRSPNKPFGIAGTRVGALWTRHPRILRETRAVVPAWPISYLDATVAASALGSSGWVGHTCGKLRDTATEMEAMLGSSFGTGVQHVSVHYRFIPTPESERVRRILIRSGVVVRAFRAGDSGRVAGIRVTAPTTWELPRLRLALN